MNKPVEKEAFAYLEKDVANANRSFLKTVPKPDDFFPAGSLIPGTGCFFPGTNILVPGTGAFRQKKTGFVTVASAFYLTKKGTYRIGSLYRHLSQEIIIDIMLPIQSTESSNKRLAPFLTDKAKKIINKKTTGELFRAYTGDPTAGPARADKRRIKAGAGKRKYNRAQQNRKRHKKNQLQKSQIRLIKQVFDGSKEYKFNKFTKEQFAKAKRSKLKAKPKKSAKIGQRKSKKENDKLFKNEQNKAIVAGNNFVLSQYKRGIKTNIITESLAQTFDTSVDRISEIRKNRLKTQAMIIAGNLWRRGRRRQPAPRKPYTELQPSFELSGRGLQGSIVYKRVVVENPYGSYGRSGDPVAVKVQATASS